VLFRVLLHDFAPHCPETQFPSGVRAGLEKSSNDDLDVPDPSPPALITDNGRRVLLRFGGVVLRVEPTGAAGRSRPACWFTGLGISIDGPNITTT
jgi:hypothetical protein